MANVLYGRPLIGGKMLKTVTSTNLSCDVTLSRFKMSKNSLIYRLDLFRLTSIPSQIVLHKHINFSNLKILILWQHVGLNHYFCQHIVKQKLCCRFFLLPHNQDCPNLICFFGSPKVFKHSTTLDKYLPS